MLDPRILVLARNSTLLLGLVLLLAVPLGTLLAIALERTDIATRRLTWVLLLIALFVPLPLVVAGWQGVLGAGGVFPLAVWSAPDWAPWATGLLPAAWVHSVALVPWVTLIVARGLANVERTLEEDALLMHSPTQVFWHVSLPRSLPAIAAATLVVAVQVTTEITVTDLLQVRTFAEEVYTQVVAPERDPLHPEPLTRAVGAALFSAAPFVALVLLLARYTALHAPASVAVSYRPALQVRLGVWRVPFSTLVMLIAIGTLAVPLSGLLWKAGLSGAPPRWTAASLATQMLATFRSDAFLIARSLSVGLVTGLICAAVALFACWQVRGSRWLSLILVVLLAVLWVTPGPIVGLATKNFFQFVLTLTNDAPLVRRLIWDGPSSLPLVIVGVLRFLPFAAAVIWPVLRLVPHSLLDLSRMDGSAMGHQVANVLWPQAARAVVTAVGVVTVLSLGELAAGKLVSTPGAEGYAEALFAQMHYGVDPALASRSLWLLFTAAWLVGGGLFATNR